jgi:hypothetical protein
MLIFINYSKKKLILNLTYFKLLLTSCVMSFNLKLAQKRKDAVIVSKRSIISIFYQTSSMYRSTL